MAGGFRGKWPLYFLYTSEDQFRLVFFQGHPEYDTVSLLKEYKREVRNFVRDLRRDYPPFPVHYFSRQTQAVFDEYQERLLTARSKGLDLPDFPEQLAASALDNTWHDTAEAVINNWVGKIYQVSNHDRKQQFMAEIDARNPLQLNKL